IGLSPKQNCSWHHAEFLWFTNLIDNPTNEATKHSGLAFPQQKHAMTTPASLASLLKNLSISNNEPDHEQILRHADGVLKTDKTNELAQRTKVVALLQLDRFEDAVKFLDSNDVPNALLEKAYALYKVGRTDEVS